MTLRKFIVGLLALGVTLGIYWVYARYHQTPYLSLHEFDDSNGFLSDHSIVADNQGGQIGGTVVKKVEETLFKDYKDGRLYREYGFKELLYEVGRIWEVKQPFMTLYLEDAVCHITANQGLFSVEEINNKVYLNDVTFTGDVHVYLEPEPNSRWEEISVDLEKFVFLSEKSQFSTSGPIYVKSPSVQLSGSGLEFVYNEPLSRIEYIRLFHLDSLLFKAPREGLFHSGTHVSQNESGSFHGSADPLITGPGSDADDVKAEMGPLYKCRLKDTVLVQTSKQMIHAVDQIVLMDIFWPKSPVKPSTTSSLPGESGEASAPVVPDTNEDPTEDLINVLVTCRDGVEIVPVDSNWLPEAQASSSTAAVLTSETPVLLSSEAQEDQGLFVAKDITYRVFSRNAVARGPVQLTFYAADVNDLNERLVPIKVTAEQEARYDAASNRIVFSGDCVCTLLQEDPNVVNRYELNAPHIRIDLVQDKENQAIAATRDLKYIVADGGSVTLGMYTLARHDSSMPSELESLPGDLLAGTEMVCKRFVYDPRQGDNIFEATGPGTIALNNAKALLVDGSGRHKPCYAFLKGFDQLKYNMDNDMIDADSIDANRPMTFNYLPVVGSNNDPNMYGQAKNVKIQLETTPENQIQLSRLTATGNVYFTNNENEFAAYGLSYRHSKKELVMWPDDDLRQPCMVNGIPVSGIYYNLATGELRTSLTDVTILDLK